MNSFSFITSGVIYIGPEDYLENDREFEVLWFSGQNIIGAGDGIDYCGWAGKGGWAGGIVHDVFYFATKQEDD